MKYGLNIVKKYSEFQITISRTESVLQELANIARNEPVILLSEVEWGIAKLRNNKGVEIDEKDSCRAHLYELWC